MTQREVPYDIDAERAVVGSLIFDASILGGVTAIMTEADFYVIAYRIIFDQIKQLIEAGQPVDHVTLGGALKASGKLPAIGGIKVLMDLTDNAVPSNVETYARRVRRLSLVRQAIVMAQVIIAEGMTTAAVDPTGFLEATRERLLSISVSEHALDRPRLIGDIVREVAGDVQGARRPTGLLKTGFAGIDARSGGLWPGMLTIVAARPGVGKSSFVYNLAANVAQGDKRVLYVTLEDLPYMVGVRHLARFSDVDNTALAIGDLKPEEIARVVSCLDVATRHRLWVLGASSVNSEAVRAAVLRHRERHGLDLLIVDHLAEIQEEAENETQAVSKAARAARDLALELAVPVIYAHQLNRKVEDRNDKRPSMSDLKQSGKIEEVARAVWFLYRDGYYTKDASRHDAQLIISKANHGRTGMVKLWADLSRMYYRDWDDAQDGRFPKQAGVADGGEVIEAASDDKAAPRSKQARTEQWLNASADLFSDRRDLDY